MSETPTDVLGWARERLANTERIAELTTFPDREGWLEDGRYWQQIVNQLAERDALRARLHTAEQELARLQDLPLCRQQVFNDGVPENTEQALRMWHRAAHNQANRADKAEAELAALQTGLAQLEQEMREEAKERHNYDEYRAAELMRGWADTINAARTRSQGE